MAPCEMISPWLPAAPWMALSMALSVLLGSLRGVASQNVECWGTARSIPSDLPHSKRVAVSKDFACSLSYAGEVTCFGSVSTDKAMPANLPAIRQINAGIDNVCVLTEDAQSVECWGGNSYGQSTVPPLPGTTEAVSCGDWVCCAVSNQGACTCWGDTRAGSTIGPPSGFIATHVACGRGFCCAGNTAGEVQCWGMQYPTWITSYEAGQTTPPSTLPPSVALSCGQNNICSISQTGSVTCWGGGSPFQTSDKQDRDQGMFGSLGTVLELANGKFTTCALQDDGHVVCVGVHTTIPASIQGKIEHIGGEFDTICASLATTTSTTTTITTMTVTLTTRTQSTSSVTSVSSTTSSSSATTVSTTTSRTSTTSSSTVSTTKTSSTSSSSSSTSSVSSSSSTSTSSRTSTTTLSTVSTSTSTTTVSSSTTSASSTTSVSSSSSTSSTSTSSTSTSSTSTSSTSTSSRTMTSTSTSTFSSSTSRTTTETTLTLSSTSSSSSSSTSSRTSSTTTTGADSSSLSSSRTTAPLVRVLTEAEKVAVASQRAAIAAASHFAASGEKTATVETDVGSVTVVSLPAAGAPDFALSTNSSSEALELVLPKEMLQSLPAGAVISLLTAEKKDNAAPTPAPFSDVKGEDGERLVTQTLDLTIYDTKGSKIEIKDLEPPLLFRLPGSAGVSGDLKCAFLDTSSGRLRWSNEGVWQATDDEVRARGMDPAGVWCFTRHLSIFAALLQVLLGCTNLELLSAEGLSAIAENKGWYSSSAARIVFQLYCVLALVLLLGGSWELWQSRFGRTFSAGKKIHICKNFLSWGPKMLKHKYAVVLVFAKDVCSCMTSGRAKLHYSSLRQGVQRFLALRTGICTACVSAHCWNGAAWIDSGASMPKTVLCSKLEFHAGFAEWVMETDMKGVCVHDVLRRYVMTVLAIHPLLDAMRVNAGSMTVLKRVALQFCAMTGVLATNGMIFNFSGELRSWEADASCPISPTSQLFILVATIVSLLINVVPNAFLADLGKQVHGHPVWNAVFWFLVLLFFLGAGLVVMVALANLNPKDSKKWYRSTEFSSLIKFLVMPLVQGLRHSVLLEMFLHMDRKSKPSKRFPVVMGCRLPQELELSEEAKCRVEKMAGQSISAEELVNFMALLGEKVFPKYDPKSSTTEQVQQEAIRPLLAKPPCWEELPVVVEVQSAQGLRPPSETASSPALWTCSVAHLGERLQGERRCMSEELSGPTSAVCQGSSWKCDWAFGSRVVELEAEHALGFMVRLGDDFTGMAWLPAEELIQAGSWQGSLPLLSPEVMQQTSDAQASWKVPGEANLVPFKDTSASRGSSHKLRHDASITVKVTLPQGYTQALTSKALQRDGSFLRRASQHEAMPPDRVVVHSRQGSFFHLVSSILTDALGDAGMQERIEKKLLEHDYQSLLEMLAAANAGSTRYWLEVFAEEEYLYHKELLASLPSILRKLRKACCDRMVADIHAGRASKQGPLKHLLVLDRGFHFLHSRSCLAEVMLAKSMCVRQKASLHPQDLAALASEMRKLSLELRDSFEDEELPWTVPFLQDKALVFRTLRELFAASSKEQQPEQSADWHKLELGDLAAVAAGVQAGSDGVNDSSGLEQLDIDADVDVGVEADV